VEMLHRHGPPPKVLWLTCGNTSNRALKALFEQRLSRALEMLQASEFLVEIRD
jgi:predicted nuclease of predicted toxin-antitoxin system